MKIFKQCRNAAITLIVIGCLIFLLTSINGTEYEEYGGDAYTGIQNAAADTANNVSKSCGILVASLGVVLLCYSNVKAFEYEENHKEDFVSSNIDIKEKKLQEEYLKAQNSDNVMYECKSCGYRNKDYYDTCPKCGNNTKKYFFPDEEKQ